MFASIKNYLKTQPKLFDLALMLFPATGPSDKFFDAFSKSHGKDVSFIQIGTSDGLRWDPLRKYIVRDKWKGVFVEPLPTVFDMLKKNYQHVASEFVFVNAAISSATGESISFYTFSDAFLDHLTLEQKLFYLRKSSFDKSHVIRAITTYTDSELGFLGAKKATDYGLEAEEILKEIKVPSLTLSQIANQYWNGKKVDILIIDAEGHEAEIIPSIDFNVLRPEAIFYESHNLAGARARVEEFLIGNGYSIEVMGGDSVALLAGKN